MKHSRPPLKQELKEPVTAYRGLGGEVVIYLAPDGKVKLNVGLEKNSLWLTQKQMALLFDTEWSVISKRLRNIFASEELDRNSVCAFFTHTGEDGKTYQTQLCNLNDIISVGNRVNSKPGTQFRIWAT